MAVHANKVGGIRSSPFMLCMCIYISYMYNIYTHFINIYIVYIYMLYYIYMYNILYHTQFLLCSYFTSFYFISFFTSPQGLVSSSKKGPVMYIYIFFYLYHLFLFDLRALYPVVKKSQRAQPCTRSSCFECHNDDLKKIKKN